MYTNTLTVIRQRISRLVDDCILATVSSGTTTTAVLATTDPPQYRNKADDYFNQHEFEVYTYAGTNIGESAVAKDWTLTTPANTLTVDRTLAIFDTTSKLELHRIFTTGELLNAINLAIEFLADKYLLDKVDETVALATGTYEYAMPSDFEFVHRITKKESGDYPIENIINPDWYRFILKSGVAYIKFHDLKYVIGADKNLETVRIEGQKRQPLLTTDTSIAYIPADWLVSRAITFLPQSKIESTNLAQTVAIAGQYASAIPAKGYYPDSKRVNY